MSNTLIDFLSELEDHRTAEGRRHSLTLVLVIAIMGAVSGCDGYRSLGDFSKRHKMALIEAFGLKRWRVPSYSTIRRVIMGLDIESFSDLFFRWAKTQAPIERSEWLSVDGKSIKGTVSHAQDVLQNFVSVVGVFRSQKGLSLHSGTFHSKKESEIVVVRDLIQLLGLQGVVFTMDALHCQKKRLKALSKQATTTSSA